MSLTQIFILAGIAILLGQIRRQRTLLLMVFSAFAIYWLQPVQSPVTITFWLPTITLLLIVFLWRLLFSAESHPWHQNLLALIILSFVVGIMGANRYLQLEQIFIVETPRFQWVGIISALFLFAAVPLLQFEKNRSRSLLILVAGLLALLVFTKLPEVQTLAFRSVMDLRGKEPTLSRISISWLGFSYIVFRLIHTILDKKAGRLASVTLAEYVDYVIFFPSVVAGPIDRLDRFVNNLNAPETLDAQGGLSAGTRFFAGLFKKFVLADGLAWIALNETFARDVHSVGWLWLLLYAYSLQIYFDFSGYTDMAIGMGRFLGVRLPENFASPYLKPNLTFFWSSWHITLTQWFRSYLFNPLTRVLRSNKSLPSSLVILFTQLITMTTIGLWHGITLNYLFWGLWHGMGLFIQNRWSDLLRRRAAPDQVTRPVDRTWDSVNRFLTFNYVSLGWLFFLLPTPQLVWQTMAKLFGVTL